MKKDIKYRYNILRKFIYDNDTRKKCDKKMRNIKIVLAEKEKWIYTMKRDIWRKMASRTIIYNSIKKQTKNRRIYWKLTTIHISRYICTTSIIIKNRDDIDGNNENMGN